MGAHGGSRRGARRPALDGVSDVQAARSYLTRDPKAAIEETEQVFAALAHESRRHILLTLKFRGGSMTAGEIAERFGCSWPTTTRHLGVLLDAGLVTVEKQGRERVYRLETGRLKEVVGEWMKWFVC